MGRLIDGAWTDQWYDTLKSGGRFLREDSQLRNWITPDGEPGPSGDGGFRAEADRYPPYGSLACPWAPRPRGATAAAGASSSPRSRCSSTRWCP